MYCRYKYTRFCTQLLSQRNTASHKSELPLQVESPLNYYYFFFKSDNIKAASPQYEYLCDPRQHVNINKTKHKSICSTSRRAVIHRCFHVVSQTCLSECGEHHNHDRCTHLSHGTSPQGLSFLHFPFIVYAVMQCILVVSPASNLHKVQISATKCKSGASGTTRCLWKLLKKYKANHCWVRFGNCMAYFAAKMSSEIHFSSLFFSNIKFRNELQCWSGFKSLSRQQASWFHPIRFSCEC